MIKKKKKVQLLDAVLFPLKCFVLKRKVLQGDFDVFDLLTTTDGVWLGARHCATPSRDGSW